MQLNSIRFKTTILYSSILAVILVIFGAIIYISISYILYRDLDHDLKVKAEVIVSILHAYEEVGRTEERRVGKECRSGRWPYQ